MDDQYEFPPDGRPPAFIENWIDEHRFIDESIPGGRPRAALYARRSIADLLDVSIGRQVADGRSWCDEAGLFLDPGIHIYIDKHRSGATLVGREGIEALIRDARAQLFEVLVVSSIDRLSRSIKDMTELAEIFDECGVTIHVAGRGPISNTEIVMLSAGAQKERTDFIQRSTTARRQMAATGQLLGKWDVYGYDRLPNGGGWAINEPEAAVIRRCFDDLDRGHTVGQLAFSLNREGIKSPRGLLWRGNNFFNHAKSGIIQKKILKGVFEYSRMTPDRVEFPVPSLQIVDTEIFDRVNDRTVRQRITLARSDLEPLFRNVRCICGCTMSRTHRAAPASNYLCSHASLGGNCIHKKKVLAADLDRQALLAIRDEILNPERLSYWEDIRKREWDRRDQASSEERALLTQRISEIDKELDAPDEEEAQDELAPLTLAIRGRLEYEHHQLYRKRSALEVSEPDPSLSDEEAERLRGVIDGLLLRLPLAILREDDRESIERLRALLPVIVAWRPVDRNELSFRFLVGIPGCPDDPKRLSHVGKERWIERTSARVLGALRYPEQILVHHRAAEAGVYAFSDPDWEAIRELFAPFGHCDAKNRMLAETLFFIAATGLPVSMLPERYAECNIRRCAIRKSGIWPVVIRILDARNWPGLVNVDRHRFDPKF